MLPYVGCSAMLAMIAFVIGLGAALYVPEIDWTARLIIAAIPAFCTFLASLLLMVRDAMRHAAAMRSARNHLLASIPTTADEFLAARPCDDAELLLDTRRAIARFFGVPAEQVHRGVNLQKDLRADALTPDFQLAIVVAVASRQKTRDETIAYCLTGVASIDELAQSTKGAVNNSAGPSRTA